MVRTINLLPWRENLRKELQQKFLTTMAGFIIITLTLGGVVHFINTIRINNQDARAQFLQTHIASVEKKIEEIKTLEKEKERLKARIDAIEQLQSNRPLIVRFFDELVTSLPEGVSILSVEQKKDLIVINGVAESNARVSSFMNRLERSDWLGGSKLSVIEAKSEGQQRFSNFTINFQQTMPGQSEEEDEI